MAREPMFERRRNYTHAEANHRARPRLTEAGRSLLPSLFLIAAANSAKAQQPISSPAGDTRTHPRIEQRNMSAVLNAYAAKEKSPHGFDARGLSLVAIAN